MARHEPLYYKTRISRNGCELWSWEIQNLFEFRAMDANFGHGKFKIAQWMQSLVMENSKSL
jgi:hypothetical protein